MWYLKKQWLGFPDGSVVKNLLANAGDTCSFLIREEATCFEQLSPCVCALSRSVVSDSLQPHELSTARLLCLWNFPWQKYWSGLPFPTPGDLPNPGIEPVSLVSSALVDSLPLHHLGSPTKPKCYNYWACALDPGSHNCWAHLLQLLNEAQEPVCCNKRSHCNEKPRHFN